MSKHLSATAKTPPVATVASPIPGVDKASFDSGMVILKSPNTWLVIAMAAIWLIFLRDSDSKGKLSNGRWGGSAERLNAKKISLKQIAAPKKNSCSLYINTPEQFKAKFEAATKYPLQRSGKKFKKVSTIYLPNTQQSVIYVGAAGMGKTYSGIDPAIRSALEQGFSTVLYDFKFPGQAKAHALYAIRRGYRVHILAPGYPESRSLNLLDFIKDSTDDAGAEQLAEVIVKNCNGGGAKDNDFFEKAGSSVVKGAFLLAKWIDEYLKKQGDTGDYGDLITASCILDMSNLAARLQHAQANPNLNISSWTMKPFSQLISAHGSGEVEANKTEASIVATAQGVFAKFIKKEFIGTFCQKSNLELNVDGKVLVILGMNQEKRDSIGPLLAAAAHMLIAGNIVHSKPRKSPLIVSLDELPTLYLPALMRWLAEARSAGFNALIGIQTFTQLQEMYGEKNAITILGNAATKFFFNPGTFESAEIISKYIGDEEIKITNKSQSYGKGGSKSTSTNLQTKSMLAPNEVLKMPPGKAVLISSGSSSKKESFIPSIQNFQISEADMEEVSLLEEKWDDYIATVAKTMPQLTDEQLETMLSERMAMISNLFPEPPPPDK